MEVAQSLLGWILALVFILGNFCIHALRFHLDCFGFHLLYIWY